ncbi:M60 family metallopeptidase [Bacillus cereus]|uniref:M60 family metallopeptidase n=1 Tax=Bacillus cereus TaxID=1396 RepID=UPI000279D951|nr:M60 family metallopeptidase [Bacillus cereus]EJR89627.1 hypothetical protein IKG_06025 [Bacillus cereus VD200]
MEVTKLTKKTINVMTTSVLTVTMFFTPLTSVLLGQNGIAHAKETKAKDTNTEGKEAEARTFYIKGKGRVEQLREIDRRWFSFSPFEPTGLYAEPNEKITINVEGNQDIQAYIGTYSYDGSPDTFTLKPGENEISSAKGGILYLGNTNEKGKVKVNVTSGGNPIPYFELGKHTKADWDAMLKKYPNAYAVELKGKRSLFTVTYKKAKEFLEGKDPSALIKKHDKAIRIQDKVSGLSESYTGVAKADTHYVHFVEDYTKKDGWMYAMEYHTAYVSGAIKFVLDLESFKKDGWGPWHEAGHQRQQLPWLWSGLIDVTANIYSLAVQRAFGNTSRLEAESMYEQVFSYLNKPQSEKSYDKIDDTFQKLAMFWQLDLAFGDNFYPKLHQMYRLISEKELNDISDDEKKQLFIQMASNVSNRNLTPFFEKWGLMPSEITKNKIKDLPKLEKEIWFGRDSKPIIENELPEYQAPSGGTPIPQTVEVGFDETGFDPNNLVKNLPHNIKITGKIDMKPIAEAGSSVAKVEIIDQIGNKNMVFVPINGIYGDSILFQGLSNWNSATLTIDHAKKQLKAISPGKNEIIHPYFSNSYYSFKVYDKDTDAEKLSVSAIGTKGPGEFVNKINNFQFNYGDIVVVFHEEPDRLHFYNNNKEVLQDNAVHTKTYVITSTGFQAEYS